MFKKTGKMVNVSYDEMAAIVNKRLADYDRIEAMTEVTPEKSPYTSPIIYVNEEGKYLQVPEFIQQKIINERINKPTPDKQINIDTFKNDTTTNYTFYIVIIIIVFIILLSSFTPYQ